jgi:hypothetical protein
MMDGLSSSTIGVMRFAYYTLRNSECWASFVSANLHVPIAPARTGPDILVQIKHCNICKYAAAGLIYIWLQTPPTGATNEPAYDYPAAF